MTTIRLPIAEARALADIAREHATPHSAALRAIEMIDAAADNRDRSSLALGDFPRQSEAHADGWIVDLDEPRNLYVIRRAPDSSRFKRDADAQSYVAARAINLGGLHDSALLWIGRANAWLEAHNRRTK